MAQRTQSPIAEYHDQTDVAIGEDVSRPKQPPPRRRRR